MSHATVVGTGAEDSSVNETLIAYPNITQEQTSCIIFKNLFNPYSLSMLIHKYGELTGTSGKVWIS